jgi:hypothetical protein
MVLRISAISGQAGLDGATRTESCPQAGTAIGPSRLDRLPLSDVGDALSARSSLHCHPRCWGHPGNGAVAVSLHVDAQLVNLCLQVMTQRNQIDLLQSQLLQLSQ